MYVSPNIVLHEEIHNLALKKKGKKESKGIKAGQCQIHQYFSRNWDIRNLLNDELDSLIQ